LTVTETPMMSPSGIGKVHLMQANLVAYFPIFAGLPGITFVEEDITWFVNANNGEPGDMILRSRISGGSIDRRIDEILNQISQYTDHIDWLVFPGCRPADLGRRLEGRGMKGGPGGTWMLADLTSLSGAPPVPDNFHVEYVSDNEMLEEWKLVSSEGFGSDCQIFYDAYKRHGFGPDAHSLHYIGYLDDTPVTSSTLLVAGGIAGIYDVSTPPPFRRQGFASAITRDMMLEAQHRGYRDAWVWSSSIGKGAYGSVGFVAADFGIREYQWHKP